MLDLEEHRSALTGYCQRIVGAAEADDAVQETMLRAWRAAGDFDRRCSTRAWLYRIATNTCCDLLRGRERRGRLEQRVQQFASAASPASPEDPARIAETRDAVRFALTVLLGVLPARQRAALILCEVLRWRADEAARALGTSQAAVASSLQRARATLAARDQADPPGAVDEELLARHMEAFLRYDITSLCFTEPRRTSEPANLSSRQGGEATVTVAPAAPTVAGNVRNWSARSPEHAIRWAMRVPWLWPALLTLAIGSYQLDRPLLWRDELWSWTFAADPAHVLIRSISSWNVAQLPYELLLHFWIAVAGDSVVALRLPSVLAMAASAAVVVLIARRLASPRAGLLAGLVFALVPSVARFAQEARFYAPQLLAVTVATLLLLRAIDVPSARRWVAYAACVAVVGYLDLVALSVLVGHAGGVTLRCRTERRLVLRFGAAVLAGGLACLPLVVGSVGKAGSQVGWIPRPGLDLAVFSGFTWQLFYSAPVAVAVIVLALLAIPAWREAGFAAPAAVLPVAAVWLLSQGAESYFFPRYLLFTVAAWAVLAGIGLSRLDGRVAAACLLAVAVLCVPDQQQIRLAGAHAWAGYPVGPSDGFYWDYSSAARWIASHAEPGDGIVYPDHGYWQMTGPGVSYYLSHDLPTGTAPPREVLIAGTAPSAGSSSGSSSGSSAAGVLPPAAAVYPPWCRDPAACLGASPRIWVVANGRPRDLGQALAVSRASALRRHYRTAYTWRFRGITVFLLDRTS